MALKRKRSVDDSPLSVSSFGAVSTPEAQSPTPIPHSYNGSMDMEIDTASRLSGWDFISASRVKNGDWGNRTRKRFRDNRPDERIIHGSKDPNSIKRHKLLIWSRKYIKQALLRPAQPHAGITYSV